MIIVLCILIFFLGGAFASFAGVLLERGRKENSWRKRFRSVATTRSMCVWCERVLARWQLIPILWRALQKGHCLHCKTPIPAWYSWFEAVMGVIFVGVFLNFYRTYGDPTTWLILPQLFPYLIAQWLLVWTLVSLLIADMLRYEVDLFFVAVLLATGIWRHSFPQTAPAWWWEGTMWWWGCFFLFRASSYLLTYRRYGTWQAGIGTGDIVLAIVLWAISSSPGESHWMRIVQYLSVYMVMASTVTLTFWALHKHTSKHTPTYLPFVPGMLIAWVLIPYVRAWYMGG